MEKKLRVGILGATGMVGQRFISLLENHPWYEVVAVAASPRSAGKTYEEAVGGRWKMTTPMPESVKDIIVMDVAEVEKVAATVDFVFSAVDMTKEEIKKIEEEYAKTETPVVSNNSAHRWTPDVPMVVPELNPEGCHVSDIYFYGAGIVSPESSASISQVLEMWCPMAQVHFYSDILAAARALFGDGSGVVAIMGTGSNSCLYECGEIKKNIRPGGFILGDEGSGVWLGREFLLIISRGSCQATSKQNL